jgi:hypothetical protein
MKRIFLAMTLIGAFIFASGCGGAQQQAPWVKGPMPADGNFDGVYQSDFGRLELTVSGESVTGLYEADQHFGRVEGAIEDNLLRFTWTQWNEDMQGKLRKTQGDGVFQYTIEEVQTATKVKYYHHLEGWWGYGKDQMSNRWNASKLTRGKKRLKPREEAGGEEGGEEGYGSVGFESGDEESAGGAAEPEEEEEDEGGGLDDVF